MAVFLDCAASPSQLDGRRLLLNFKRYPGTWIYCNFPENLPAAALGDARLGNKYLNRALVFGEAELFASYVNATGSDIKFGVLLCNAGPAVAGVLRKNQGHRHSGIYPDWCDVAGGVWRDFCSRTDQEILAIPPGGSAWIFEQPVPNNKFFNSALSLKTDLPLDCYVYVYRSRANIDGTASCLPLAAGSAGESGAAVPRRGLFLCHRDYRRALCQPHALPLLHLPLPGRAGRDDADLRSLRRCLAQLQQLRQQPRQLGPAPPLSCSGQQ